MPYEGPVNDDLLRFDALDTAEKLTGKSYKEDEGTSAFGLLLLHENGEKKRKLLSESCDTYFGQPLAGYLEVVLSMGFQQVVAEPFKNYHDGKDETYYIFWHPDGILLSFDSWGGNHVNGGHFYYSWIPNPGVEWWLCTSSGGMDLVGGKDVWHGHHDCREALRFHITKLRDNGTFLVPWAKDPSLWLGHYTEHHADASMVGTTIRHHALNKKYLAMFPKDAHDAVAPAWFEHAEEIEKYLASCGQCHGAGVISSQDADVGCPSCGGMGMR